MSNEEYFAEKFIELGMSRDEVFQICSKSGFKLRRQDDNKVVKVYVSRILAIMHENEDNSNIPAF
jgi:hypothetical protein